MRISLLGEPVFKWVSPERHVFTHTHDACRSPAATYPEGKCVWARKLRLTPSMCTASAVHSFATRLESCINYGIVDDKQTLLCHAKAYGVIDYSQSKVASHALKVLAPVQQNRGPENKMFSRYDISCALLRLWYQNVFTGEKAKAKALRRLKHSNPEKLFMYMRDRRGILFGSTYDFMFAAMSDFTSFHEAVASRKRKFTSPIFAYACDAWRVFDREWEFSYNLFNGRRKDAASQELRLMDRILFDGIATPSNYVSLITEPNPKVGG